MRRAIKVMKCSTRPILAAVIAAVFPMSGFAQSGDQSQNSTETALREQEIAPGQGLGFVLGDTAGVAYFTSEPDGLRLVATVGNAGATPIRVITTLAPDQIAIVSVPSKVGQASIEVSFLRRGERVIVRAPWRATN
jgi:hypothetical protein